MDGAVTSLQTDVRARRTLVVLLGLLTSLDAMSIDIYMPAIPMLQATFDTTATLMQASLSALLMGMVFGQLVWGPISDRYGRRRPLLAGLGLYMLGSLLAMAAPDIGTFIMARFVQAIGASSGIVIARAIVDDCFERDVAPRIYTLLMQILGVTALVSPLLGGAILLTGDWRPIFALLVVVGAACAVACLRSLPETLPAERRVEAGFRDLLHSFGELLTSRPFLGAALAGAFSMGGMFAILAGSSFYFIQQAGWTPTAYSVLYAASSVTFVAACQVNIWALARFGAARICGPALAVQAVFGLVLVGLFAAGIETEWTVLALMICLLGVIGFIFGNVTAFAMAAVPGHAGVASGLLGLLQFLVSALCAPITAASANVGYSMALTVGGCAVAAFVAWLAVGKESPAGAVASG